MNRLHVVPKDEQLKVVESIGRGEDRILIAGCGWGKSLVYSLAAVLWPDRVIVVVTPHDSVIRDQQSKKLQALGISCLSLIGNGKIGPDAMGKMARGEFNIILTTPEVILDDEVLWRIWQKDEMAKKVQAVVLDDVHCMNSWGKVTKNAYCEIAALRARAPPCPFIALSAVLPPMVLEDVRRTVYFSKGTVINVGNDRPNIRLEVRRLGNYALSKNLDFLLDFKTTIVYFESATEAVRALKYLKALAPADKKDKIAVYHSLMSEDYRQNAINSLMQGELFLLLSTEAGAGCDIDDVVRVVQFRRPDNISSLVLRFGRAAHNSKSQACGILMVSKFDTKSSDPSLEEYINTNGCRRKVLDSVFGNTASSNDNCCDNCHPVLEISHSPPNAIPKDQLPKYRVIVPTPEQKEDAKEKILEWRARALIEYRKRYRGFTAHVVLSENSVEKLANQFTKVTSLEALKSITGMEPLKEECFVELTEILMRMSEDIKAQDRKS
ncbi:hypothetical protein BGX27_004400 [Mortierella sp. AM989]|nr:hypothetical protein BGX27_004400 [Mortierella sp. AM989]